LIPVLLGRLLDRPLPLSPPDARAFRVGLLADLAPFREDRQVEERLLSLARDPRSPRGERLAAIEALCAEHGPRHTVLATLERVANDDHDLVIRRKVEWALRRDQG